MQHHVHFTDANLLACANLVRRNPDTCPAEPEVRHLSKKKPALSKVGALAVAIHVLLVCGAASPGNVWVRAEHLMVERDFKHKTRDKLTLLREFNLGGPDG